MPGPTSRAEARRARMAARNAPPSPASAGGWGPSISEFASNYGERAREVGGGLKSLIRSPYDIYQNMQTPEGFKASVEGFKEGAGSAFGGFFTDPLQAAGNVFDPGVQSVVEQAIDPSKDRSGAAKAGRAAFDLSLAALPFVGKYAKPAVKGAAKAVREAEMFAPKVKPKITDFQQTTAMNIPRASEAPTSLRGFSNPPGIPGDTYVVSPYRNPGRRPVGIPEQTGPGTPAWSMGPSASSGVPMPPPPNFYGGVPGIPSERFGGVRLGTVEAGVPKPVSAGMGRTSDAQAAFEAMVPERYKGGVAYEPDLQNMEGAVGPVAPRNPRLGTVTERGIRPAPAPPGTKSVAQMVQEYGVEETARRTGMTIKEVKAGRILDKEPKVTVKVAPRNPPPAPQPKPKPAPVAKVEPTLEERLRSELEQIQKNPPPPVETAPSTRVASGARPLAQASDEAVGAQAARGNKSAQRELALREQEAAGVIEAPKPQGPNVTKQNATRDYLQGMVDRGEAMDLSDARTILQRRKEQPRTKPVGTGPLARLRSESGAVGRNVEQRVINKFDPTGGEPAPFTRSNQDPRWVEVEQDARKLGIDTSKFDNIEDLEWEVTRKTAQQTVKTGKNPLWGDERGAVGRDIGPRGFGPEDPGDADFDFLDRKPYNIRERLQRLYENEEGAIKFKNLKEEDFHEMWRRLQRAQPGEVSPQFARNLLIEHGEGPPGLTRASSDPDDFTRRVVYRDTKGKPIVVAELSRGLDNTWGISSFGADPNLKGSLSMGKAMEAVTKHMLDDVGVRGPTTSISADTRNYITKLVTRGTGKTAEELDALLPPEPRRRGASYSPETNWSPSPQASEGRAQDSIARLRQQLEERGLQRTPPEPDLPNGEQSFDYEQWVDAQERARQGRGDLATQQQLERGQAFVDAKNERDARAAARRNPQRAMDQVEEAAEGGGPGVGDRLRRLAEDETGAITINPQVIKRAIGDVANIADQARMTSMLSGLALPKSLLGNVGAHIAAAAEGQTTRPLRALADFRNIGRDLKTGWQAGHNPTMQAGFGKLNVPGRMMGAADYAATRSLMRSGLTEQAAKELLLTESNPVAKWKPLNSPLGKLLVPFKTTPFNQLGQGLTRGKKHPYIYGGAIAAGAGAGALTDDPETLALASALAGPYALPLLMGASLTAGPRALQGVSPIPEWSITKTLTEPWSPFTESPGARWFEPNLGFGKSGGETSQTKRTSVRRSNVTR